MSESRAAEVLPRWKEKKNPYILFMLCLFFTFLLFLVRLFHTWFSCLLLTSVRESAKSSPFTCREKPKPRTSLTLITANTPETNPR